VPLHGIYSRFDGSRGGISGTSAPEIAAETTLHHSGALHGLVWLYLIERVTDSYVRPETRRNSSGARKNDFT
jgi:hypothetical protein